MSSISHGYLSLRVINYIENAMCEMNKEDLIESSSSEEEADESMW